MIAPGRHLAQSIHFPRRPALPVLLVVALFAVPSAVRADAALEALLAGQFDTARRLLAADPTPRHRRLLAGLKFNGLGGRLERAAACRTLDRLRDDSLAYEWAARCPWTLAPVRRTASPLCAEAECGVTGKLERAAEAIRQGRTAFGEAPLGARRADGSTLLAGAAGTSLPALAALLERGADPNSRNPRTGDTPLHQAARSGDPARIELLLAHGADPVRPNRNGETPLDVAPPGPARTVLAAADGQVTNRYSIPALRADQAPQAAMEAALRHAIIADAALLERLLRDPEIAALCRARCDIHLAARLDKPRVLELLLALGSDPEQPDARGETPLWIAARHGHGACLRLLWPANADRAAEALLTFAASLPDTFIETAIADLLARGALDHYATALARSLSASGRATQALVLLPYIDPPSRNALLLEAARRGQSKLVSALLDSGVDPDAAGPNGTTALMYAAANDDHEAVAALLAAGAKIDTVDGKQNSALMYAARSAAERSYRLLRKRGADTRRRNLFGRSAEEMFAAKV